MCHHSQVNDSVCDILQSFICVYLDDLLSFLPHNMEERMQRIRLVLQRVKNKIIHESRKM